jgi:hypothetical protein
MTKHTVPFEFMPSHRLATYGSGLTTCTRGPLTRVLPSVFRRCRPAKTSAANRRSPGGTGLRSPRIGSPERRQRPHRRLMCRRSDMSRNR